ncbi:MAG: type II secretion system protein [Patescibacteria group bacterium]
MFSLFSSIPIPQDRESRFRIGKLNLAFTMIEFLVVFGIIGIVTTLSIASYNTFTESYKLKNEVQNSIAVLSLAQKRAMAGEDVSSDSSCSGKTFDSFIVSFTAGAGYTMQGQCVDGVGAKTAYGTPVEYSIDAVNRNISILDTVTITFNKLTGAPIAADSIVFKNESGEESEEKCMQIDISATGLISSSNVDCPTP